MHPDQLQAALRLVRRGGSDSEWVAIALLWPELLGSDDFCKAAVEAKLTSLLEAAYVPPTLVPPEPADVIPLHRTRRHA